MYTIYPYRLKFPRIVVESFKLLEGKFSGAGDISKQMLLFIKSLDQTFDLEDMDVLSFL